MKRIQYIILLAVTTLSTSCLEKYPSDSLLESESMQTLSDAEQTLNGVYATMKSSYLYSGSMVLAQDIQADVVYAVDGFSNAYGDFWDWDITADDSTITGIYASLYGIVGQCNFYLEYADRVESSIIEEEDFAKFDLYTGEIYFARALAYSELVRIFCKAYTEEIADDENSGMILSTSYTNPGVAIRSTLRETYELILSDLSKAAQLINTDYSDAIYFTEGAVEALYARVYLHMEDWDSAIEYSSRLIDDRSDVYALATSDYNYDSSNTYNDIGYMWHYDSSYEIIWKVGMTLNSYGGALGTVFFNYNYVNFYPDYVPASWVLSSYNGSSDSRYAYYFMSVTTGYSHALTWPLVYKYWGNADFVSSYILNVNMPKVFRLAEQYLIRAEAYAQKGNYTLASEDLTTLTVARTGSGSFNLTSSNWLETISKERTKELFMEGYRLSDLKRWNMGFERAYQTSVVETNSDLVIEAGDYRFVWPIPNHEITAPDSQIVQNEGY